MRARLLIVGGSYAASELAFQARESGYSEDVLIVTDDHHLAYHRPPLSKSFLKDEKEQITSLRAEALYRTKSIEVELGKRVVSIDSSSNRAELSDGTTVSFDTLALATGARARILPGLEARSGNVFYLRTVSDAVELRSALPDAENVVIIGGGFIGLEVASALVRQGKLVTIIEAGSRVLARAVSPELSNIITKLHTSNGVNVLHGAKFRPITGKSGRVENIELEDGTSIRSDILVVGIGSEPNVDLANDLKLSIGNGIVVDERSRTSRANVYAAGDCASFKSPFNIEGMRLESVQNATDQARVAGNSIAGGAKVYHAVPWFWSDQYEYKIQIAGLPGGQTECLWHEGENSDISVFHFRDDACVSVETLNRPRDHIAARRLLASGKKITRRDLLDANLDLSALLKAL